VDFIERWLHVSPDGGNGMYEAALLVALVLFVAAVWRVATRARRGSIRSRSR
jgi:hypothetical protein